MNKLLLLLLCITGFTNAQIVDIPDVNFKAKLLAADASNTTAKNLAGNYFKIDANNDGEIQETEALTVSYLYVKGEPLDIFNTNIFSLIGIEALSNLETLDCSQNNLTSLDVTQNVNLQTLNCNSSGDFYFLSSLDVTPLVNLQRLDFSSHELTSIDVTQNIDLQELSFGRNLLTNIDLTNNVNLQTLVCFSNDLTSLDVSQNINLQSLEFSDNDLTSLDVSQNVNLEVLRFSSNQLTNLDVTENVNLQVLYFSNNYVTSLDVSENVNLQNLNFGANEITTLDVTQNVNLQYLTCYSNLLTNLDLSQNYNLQSVECYDNPITTLFVKNGSDQSIMLESPFAEFDVYALQYICADEFQVDQIQNLARSETVVNSYCSVNPGGNYNTISGSVLLDIDNNGCGMTDLQMLNTLIDINDGTSQSYVNVDDLGNYDFYSQDGTFTIATNIENSDWFAVSPSSVVIPFTDNNNNVATQDFCVTSIGVFADAEIVIIPIIAAQPGFDAIYQLVYKNKGNQVLSGTIDFNFNDDVLDYVSATILPDSQITGSMSWNYNDLLPFESRSILITLNVNSPMDTPAVNIDNQLDFVATVNPVSSDDLPNDNSVFYKQIVIGSYDPNDITCLEGDIVSPELIGEYLHYNINFENTGTAAATFIVVRDDIDATKYDLNTLQVMYASHEMTTKITDNLVEFRFDAINLEPDGTGNIVFKIKTKNTLGIGDSVSNEAAIFFDYNFPIETNSATTAFEALSVEEFEQDNSVSVYPNPTNGQLFINSTYTIEGLTLYDIQGRQVQSFSISEENIIDITNVSKGVYFLEITTTKGKSTKKIVKD